MRKGRPKVALILPAEERQRLTRLRIVAIALPLRVDQGAVRFWRASPVSPSGPSTHGRAINVANQLRTLTATVHPTELWSRPA